MSELGTLRTVPPETPGAVRVQTQGWTVYDVATGTTQPVPDLHVVVTWHCLGCGRSLPPDAHWYTLTCEACDGR